MAALSGISTTWYTWIEQGREISLSTEALVRLAGALRLSAAERAYLFELTRRRDPVTPVAPVSARAAPTELLAVLEACTAPAYLLDRRWTVRGWNQPAGHLFAPWFDGREPCLVRFVFLDPTAPTFIVGWADRARRLLAEFRADIARNPDDRELDALVRALKRDSPLFARLWRNHAVLSREGGERAFNHPEDGLMRFRQTTLAPSTHPDHKLVLLLPA